MTNVQSSENTLFSSRPVNDNNVDNSVINIVDNNLTEKI